MRETSRTRYAILMASSLEVATGETQTYRCPLCLAPFPVSQADTLTWDHFPPQSIGGRDRDVALICHTCRSRWDRIDANLHRLQLRDSFEQQHPGMIPVTLSFPGQGPIRGLRHRAAVGAKAGSIIILGRPASNPDHVTDRLVSYLDDQFGKETVSDLTLQFQEEREMVFSRRQAELSFLKAAYLALFNCFGYPYILSDGLARIREQMVNPNANCLDGFALVFSPPPRGYDRQIELALVYSPAALTSLAVFFLGYGLSRWCVAFLPIPAQPGLPMYGRLADSLRDAGGMGLLWIDRSARPVTDRSVIVVDEHGVERPLYTGQEKPRANPCLRSLK